MSTRLQFVFSFHELAKPAKDLLCLYDEPEEELKIFQGKYRYLNQFLDSLVATNLFDLNYSPLNSSESGMEKT